MPIDLRLELAQVEVPVLIIHGDSDALAPLDVTARPAAAQIPEARLAVYEGGPQGLYYTHKERLNQGLTRFIRDKT